jgi:ribosomal protein S18 acetylase RimI-like enzyme
MTRSTPFRLAFLDASLDRARFASDSEALNRYFHQQVTQDVRRRITACFVALETGDTHEGNQPRIAGYYTLASSSVLLQELPESTGKKLPRYPSVPVVRMGRLAVATTFKGMGLGAALLADALSRASRAEIAAYALVVDAKDDQAAAFYRHHGFIGLPSKPMTLFLPLSTVKSLE